MSVKIELELWRDEIELPPAETRFGLLERSEFGPLQVRIDGEDPHSDHLRSLGEALIRAANHRTLPIENTKPCETGRGAE